jgi:hypothetical protein
LTGVKERFSLARMIEAHEALPAEAFRAPARERLVERHHRT